MKYHNECYKCYFEWDSDDETENCPECGAWDNVGTEPIE